MKPRDKYFNIGIGIDIHYFQGRESYIEVWKDGWYKNVCIVFPAINQHNLTYQNGSVVFSTLWCIVKNSHTFISILKMDV